MRKVIFSIFSMLILCLFTTQGISQQMTWTTKSTEAKALAQNGGNHFMNAEFAQAYHDFYKAIELDPDFTVALCFMANLTYGESRKDYAQKALKSAENKTEGEQLFASTLDGNSTAASRRDVWDKLHKMFPDGAVIGSIYVQTRATPEERFTAAEEYLKKYPDQPSMYNTIAYYYMLDKKDNDKAKQYFDKYIVLYPDGCNPYDSMGEFFFNTGDMDNSEKYYKLALEKYPFNNSSINALQKMEDAKKK